MISTTNSFNILKQFRKLFRKSNYTHVKCTEDYIISLRDNHENSSDIQLLFLINSINQLSELERKILYHKYISVEKYTNIYICLNLSMSERTFYRVLHLAHDHLSEILSTSDDLSSWSTIPTFKHNLNQFTTITHKSAVPRYAPYIKLNLD